MNSLLRFFLVVAAAAATASCTKDEVRSGYGKVNLKMILPEHFTTRSQLVDEATESSILNYGVVIWDTSHPKQHGLHIDLKGSMTSTLLPSGKDYFAVGFANMLYGRDLDLYSLDPNDNFYLFNITFSLYSPSLSGLNEGYDGITMVSTYGKHFHLDEGEDLDLSFQLERSLARIDILLDKSLLRNASVNVTSVKIKNCSSLFLPFYTENGAGKDITNCYHGDGDSASASQLQKLNSGSAIALYAVENLQGTRTDQNYMKSHCTYVEIAAQHSILGDIKYRCYIGNGNEGNYDVKRNCLYTVKFRPTDDAGGASCWRTEF